MSIGSLFSSSREELSQDEPVSRNQVLHVDSDTLCLWATKARCLENPMAARKETQ